MKLYYCEYANSLGFRQRFVLENDYGVTILKEGSDEITMTFDSFKSFKRFLMQQPYAIVELT